MNREAERFYDYLANNSSVSMIYRHPIADRDNDLLVGDVFDYFEEATFTITDELVDFAILTSEIVDDVNIHIFFSEQPGIPCIVSIVFFAAHGEILTYKEGIEAVKKGYEYAQLEKFKNKR